MERLKKTVEILLTYFEQDKEDKKQIYLKKLEKMLSLAIIFYQKYDGKTDYYHSFYNQNTRESFTMIIDFKDDYRFKFKNNQGIKKYSNSYEIAEYLWEEQMDIKALVNSLFNCIDKLMSQKSNVVQSINSQYETDIKLLDEAIVSLEELNNIEISEDVRKL